MNPRGSPGVWATDPTAVASAAVFRIPMGVTLFSMPRPIHFEIHADDPARAIRFYQSVFGWTFAKWDGPMPYWLVTTGADDTPGINGGLLPRQGPRPVEGQAVGAFVCTVDVPGVDEFASRAEQAGGRIVMPKAAIPGIGWLSYLKDTEGNIVGMMQNDPKAK
jgi:predicted enzyme related to lactoylglutathione lyase